MIHYTEYKQLIPFEYNSLLLLYGVSVLILSVDIEENENISQLDDENPTPFRREHCFSTQGNIIDGCIHWIVSYLYENQGIIPSDINEYHDEYEIVYVKDLLNAIRKKSNIEKIGQLSLHALFGNFCQLTICRRRHKDSPRPCVLINLFVCWCIAGYARGIIHLIEWLDILITYEDWKDINDSYCFYSNGCIQSKLNIPKRNYWTQLIRICKCSLNKKGSKQHMNGEVVDALQYYRLLCKKLKTISTKSLNKHSQNYIIYEDHFEDDSFKFS